MNDKAHRSGLMCKGGGKVPLKDGCVGWDGRADLGMLSLQGEFGLLEKTSGLKLTVPTENWRQRKIWPNQ